jgi:phospho-N-acetylmuramoyl-pentapeptide-transferase
MLRNLKIGQTIREDGPRSHLAKTGTPTMGGVIFIISLTVSILLLGKLTPDVLLVLASTLSFGAVGFMDDFIKVVKKRNLGLRAYQKILGQLIASALIIAYGFYFKGGLQEFHIPLLGKLTIQLGIFTIPFFLTVILGTVNAVNLTDGLDGLATGISIIVFSTFGVMLGILEKWDLSILAFAFVGALLGFLLFNYKPAKVFMGDTGSLALGGALASLAVISELTFFIPLVAGIFFVETLSVMLQVGYFKLTKKRLFRMAPLHHHYEQKGWGELKVVWRFWAASVIFALTGLLLF